MAVLKNFENLKYLPKEIVLNKEKINLILDLILADNNHKIKLRWSTNSQGPLAILPSELADDEDLVIKFLQIHPSSYSVISERLLKNKQFNYALVNNGINISRHLTSELKSDREFIKFACKKSITYLEHTSYQLKNDKKFILEIQHIFNETKLYDNYGQKDEYLDFLDDDLESSILWNKEDKNNQINEEFLDYNKLACSIKFASKELKNNQKFIKKIIKLQPKSIEFISEHLKKDIVFLKKCLKRNPDIYNYLNKGVQENPEIKSMYLNIIEKRKNSDRNITPH
jgi:hypothetical protein